MFCCVLSRCQEVTEPPIWVAGEGGALLFNRLTRKLYRICRTASFFSATFVRRICVPVSTYSPRLRMPAVPVIAHRIVNLQQVLVQTPHYHIS
jgi:hypothetical protein